MGKSVMNKKRFEHKNKLRGSIRVEDNGIFWEDAMVDCVFIWDDVSEKDPAKVYPSCSTNKLEAILDRHGIKHLPDQYEGKRLKEDIPGLDYDSISRIKGDTKHLRIKYSTFNKKEIGNLLFAAKDCLDELHIKCGETDGKLFCIRGGCMDEEGLRSYQKEIDE